MSDLNASLFQYSSDVYHKEFSDILSKIVLCYKMIQSSGYVLVAKENEIRDHLLINYLKNNDVRQQLKLKNYDFDRESPEDRSKGIVDIKIKTQQTFEDTSYYYTIECKLLKDTNTSGTTGLNAKYIANGIHRFTSNYYFTSQANVNGMIGFVVCKCDIDKCVVDCINNLLDVPLKNSKQEEIQVNTVAKLQQTTYIPDFKYQYVSKHNINNSRTISICHLMMDFSDNIQSN